MGYVVHVNDRTHLAFEHVAARGRSAASTPVGVAHERVGSRLRNMAPDRPLDVCMPTMNSADVIGETLAALQTSLETGPWELNRLIVIDNVSTDGTVELIDAICETHGWDVHVERTNASLPQARERAIAQVRTDWFLFLDDDARIDPTYLHRLHAAISDAVGGIQGRKRSKVDVPNSTWAFRRARRGGTHATLIRTEAVAEIEIPPDLVVLEDECIRRHVEAGGYLWIFNHQALFDHDNQQRHPKGWQQGYLGGKYDLSPGYLDLILIPHAVVNGRSPVPNVTRLLGWIVGKAVGRVSHRTDERPAAR